MEQKFIGGLIMPSIRNYLTGLRPIILLILSIIAAGYAGAYPYLDPTHFDWRNGIITFVLSATTFAVFHAGHVDNRNKLSSIESSLPVADRATRQQRAIDPDDFRR
jgi:hypothetical protein